MHGRNQKQKSTLSPDIRFSGEQEAGWWSLGTGSEGQGLSAQDGKVTFWSDESSLYSHYGIVTPNLSKIFKLYTKKSTFIVCIPQ